MDNNKIVAGKTQYYQFYRPLEPHYPSYHWVLPVLPYIYRILDNKELTNLENGIKPEKKANTSEDILNDTGFIKKLINEIVNTENLTDCQKFFIKILQNILINDLESVNIDSIDITKTDIEFLEFYKMNLVYLCSDKLKNYISDIIDRILNKDTD